MTVLLNASLLALALLVLLPTAVVCAQTLLALWPTRKPDPDTSRRPRLAVLVPAHNEAAGIAATLATLRPQLAEGDELLVIADNCTDDTARAAAAEGATVIERSDADRRGKGYALDFGIRHLHTTPPEVVVIVDADCHMRPGGLARLASRSQASGRPVQALYLMQPPLQAPLKTRIAAFAWTVRNWVRPLGSHRLGMPCQLMGTGMAFPWALLRDARLASGELVEDMKLGIDLALSGHPPLFCPEALVTSHFPETNQAVATQRTRWEHGHLGMILNEVPRLLGHALGRGDARLLALALDLAVPPLALLVALIATLGGLASMAYLAGLSIFPLALAALAMCLLALSVLLAWLGWGRGALPLAALLSVPFYVLAKVPMYLKFCTRRQTEWVRTERK